MIRLKARAEGVGGVVLRFSSDRDDLTIFGGLKFSISGFFLARKILASIFLGSLI